MVDYWHCILASLSNLAEKMVKLREAISQTNSHSIETIIKTAFMQSIGVLTRPLKPPVNYLRFFFLQVFLTLHRQQKTEQSLFFRYFWVRITCQWNLHSECTLKNLLQGIALAQGEQLHWTLYKQHYHTCCSSLLNFKEIVLNVGNAFTF